MTVEPVALSRAMSHALRHDPARYGLTLDAEGWTPVHALLDGLRDHGLPVTRDDVEQVVRSGSKQRHEIDGERIRARYGHSTDDRVHLPEAAPPTVLFHGTSPSVLATIRREGLRPMGRQYVHLSPTWETARRVGRRHNDDPLVLRVDAVGAAESGVVFRRGNDDTWLADTIPVAFLECPGGEVRCGAASSKHF